MSPSPILPRRCLGPALALLTGMAALAAVHAGAAPARHAPALADFAPLSGARAHACAAPVDPRLAGLGTPAQRSCAWSGRVEMLYWRAITLPERACLPPGAIAWQRLASTTQGRFAPWNAAWTSQALFSDAAGTRQAFALWREADGAWSAALWRWQPSDKPATRAWQERHWNAVLATAGAHATQAPAPAPLLQAWVDATAGTPRVVDGDTWRWVARGACLGLQTAGVQQAQLHLPWSRDDARLEQRSAMQVQLARRFPDAEWLKPFSLLDPAVPGNRSGAKFIAVWKQGASVDGQLWMPLREDGGVVRAHIASALAPGAREDAVKARADLVEAQLTALARAWEARHD